MGGHHKAKNWGCPETVDTNGSSPMPDRRPGDGVPYAAAFLKVHSLKFKAR